MRLAPLPVCALALALAVVGCDSGEPTSLYDPDNTGAPAPTIASVAPEGVVLAGIDVVTITGTNFSPDPAANFVYFEAEPGSAQTGTVLSASPTELVVQTPNLPSENVTVRVSVLGAASFSNAVARPLSSAITPFGDLDPGFAEELFSLTRDATGAPVGTLVRDGSVAGVFRFDPATGERAPYFSTTFFWSDLAFAGGILHGARRIRALFRLPEGGAQQTFFVQPTGASLATITGGPDGELWVAGSNTTPENGRIYRVEPDGSFTETPFADIARDLVVFEGALYVVAEVTGVTQVLRFPIQPDGSLGDRTVYASVPMATSIAFAADGTAFVGTNAENDAVVEVPAGGGTPATLYPGVVPGPITAMAWDASSGLYLALAATDDEDARLFRLETRREGAP